MFTKFDIEGFTVIFKKIISRPFLPVGTVLQEQKLTFAILLFL